MTRYDRHDEAEAEEQLALRSIGCTDDHLCRCPRCRPDPPDPPVGEICDKCGQGIDPEQATYTHWNLDTLQPDRVEHIKCPGPPQEEPPYHSLSEVINYALGDLDRCWAWDWSPLNRQTLARLKRRWELEEPDPQDFAVNTLDLDIEAVEKAMEE